MTACFQELELKKKSQKRKGGKGGREREREGGKKKEKGRWVGGGRRSISSNAKSAISGIQKILAIQTNKSTMYSEKNCFRYD